MQCRREGLLTTKIALNECFGASEGGPLLAACWLPFRPCLPLVPCLQLQRALLACFRRAFPLTASCPAIGWLQSSNRAPSGAAAAAGKRNRDAMGGLHHGAAGAMPPHLAVAAAAGGAAGEGIGMMTRRRTGNVGGGVGMSGGGAGEASEGELPGGLKRPTLQVRQEPQTAMSHGRVVLHVSALLAWGKASLSSFLNPALLPAPHCCLIRHSPQKEMKQQGSS